MILEHKDKEYELKYTYNSFRYMQDLDLGELEVIESKPFRIIGFTEELLMGAINNDPKKKVGVALVSNIVETRMDEGKLMELMENLIKLLEESSFFKNLQK